MGLTKIKARIPPLREEKAWARSGRDGRSLNFLANAQGFEQDSKRVWDLFLPRG